MDIEKLIKEMEDFRKSYIESSVYTFNLDMIDVDILLRYINDLYNELKKKDEVIDNAIHYICEITEDEENIIFGMDSTEVNNLLQILEDKEVE